MVADGHPDDERSRGGDSPGDGQWDVDRPLLGPEGIPLEGLPFVLHRLIMRVANPLSAPREPSDLDELELALLGDLLVGGNP